ncbi:cytochrome P450 [Streptomyces sp. NPDC091281]|uniref:cytochrome P450 n=1 Tax=Streptomyces sp. NPDC091281 TaxID=3365985 RepID=UPI003806E8EC
MTPTAAPATAPAPAAARCPVTAAAPGPVPAAAPAPAPAFAERYLLSPDMVADPYAHLDALRAHAPVHWSPLHHSWLVTGYDQVMRCLRDPGISADRVRPLMDAVPQGASEDAERAFGILSRWMVFNDPPQHRRLRQVFQESFAARAVARYRTFTEKATRAVLSRGAVPGRTGDLMADVAKPLPALVFARWLGVPRTDAASFWYWNARVADLVLGTAQEESEYRASLQALVSLEDYLGALVARRRAEPGDDLISQVLREGRVGDSVTEEEFVGMLTQMAFAGGETTSNLIANTVLALHTRPDQLAAVRAEPDLAQGAVEETLRLDGPSKMSVRTAARDVDLDGRTLRAGDRVFLVTAAANRDPARFPDPGRFDVRRTGATHLGFGFGAHFCIGAALARLVAVAAVRTLVTDRPALTLADPGRVAWQPSLLNRSLTALPVRY